MIVAGVQVRDATEYVVVDVIVTAADLVIVPATPTSVATCGAVEVEVETWKLSVLRIDGTVTLAGYVIPVAVVENLTVNPAAGAGEARVTVHVL